MGNNKLIIYKENIFTKITNFFRKIFCKSKEQPEENTPVKETENIQHKNDFVKRITIQENPEEKRLKQLQYQYENGEIDEDEISEEDQNKLIEMYEKETEQLNSETERIKQHISQMLKELKTT